MVGYDVNKDFVDKLNNVLSYIQDVSGEELSKYLNSLFCPTNNPDNSESTVENALKEVDCAIFVFDHNVFKKIDLSQINYMASSIIVDCNNLFSDLKLDFMAYLGSGKSNYV